MGDTSEQQGESHTPLQDTIRTFKKDAWVQEVTRNDVVHVIELIERNTSQRVIYTNFESLIDSTIGEESGFKAEDPNYKMYACYKDDKVIGCCEVNHVKPGTTPMFAEVNILVDRKWRGDGYGRAFFSTILAQLSREGVQRVVTSVDGRCDHTEKMLKFYASHGFSIFDTYQGGIILGLTLDDLMGQFDFLRELEN